MVRLKEEARTQTLVRHHHQQHHYPQKNKIGETTTTKNDENMQMQKLNELAE